MTDAQVIALIAAHFYTTPNGAPTRVEALSEAASFLAGAEFQFESIARSIIFTVALLAALVARILRHRKKWKAKLTTKDYKKTI